MIDGDGRVSTLDTSSLPVHDALEGMLRDMELGAWLATRVTRADARGHRQERRRAHHAHKTR